MRLRTPEAGEIDATFEVSNLHADGRFDITVESAGGARADGRPRNPEYPSLLEELLRRAAGIGAVIEDALVDSRRVAGLPSDERRIDIKGQNYPFALSQDHDFAELRRRFTRPQANIGTARQGGGGNERKRITISFRVERADLDRSSLATLLDATESAPPSRKAAVAAGLTGKQIEAAIERWGQIGRDAFLAEFDARAAQKYVVAIDDGTEVDALALILGARAMAGMEVEGPWRGDRANVAVPLRELGFGVSDISRPLEAPLGGDPSKYVDLAGRLGGTDIAVRRMARAEQGYLRGALGIGSGDPGATGSCGICARQLPQRLLVAAHIKPRYLCSDDERIDLPHVGWALCVLGCDALFEHGYVGVDYDGRIKALRDVRDEPSSLHEAVEALIGPPAPGWTTRRAPYFLAHAVHHLPSPRI